MKSLRYLLAIVFLVLSVIMIIGLLKPSTWEATAEVTIDDAQGVVFAAVDDLKDWAEWAVWFEHDASMQTTFSDPSSGPGAHYTWIGDQTVGEGRLEIRDVEEPDLLTLQLEMNDGAFLADGRIEFTFTNDATRVVWTLGGDLGLDPFARLNSGLLENAVSGTLQANLDKLKSLIELE